MKRTISWVMLTIYLFLLIPLVPAEAGVETPSYGFSLGKYDAATDKYNVGASEVFWKDRQYWTNGPWAIFVDDVRRGSVINFADALLDTDNGYPLVGSDKWDQWIAVFGGEPGYVKGQLNSLNTDLSWKIKTPSGDRIFANLSDIAVLSGGKGGPFDAKKMLSNFSTSTKPTSSLTASKTAIQAGESITFTLKGTTNTYYNQYLLVSFAGGGKTYFSEKRFEGKNITHTENVTFPNPGTYTFSLRLKDAVMRQADVKTVLVSVSPVNQVPVEPVQPPPNTPPPPEPPADPEETVPNQPPLAQFSWPSSAYAEEAVHVEEFSVDYDGSITNWDWDLSAADASSSLGRGGGVVRFTTPGKYDLDLTVTDDDGATDSIAHSITVYQPIPTAVITTSGTLKENRKVVLSSSSSRAPASWPIDPSKDEWTIAPVSGGTASDIKLGTRTDPTQEVLFKKAGVYKASLRVTNAKGTSEWVEKLIDITPDVAPVADFSLNTLVNYRNPADAKQANIILTDNSRSSDMDLIAQRTWSYKFDADNDGDFSDEVWVVFSSGNSTTPSVKVNKVGGYLFHLTVKEDFGQPTLSQFIQPSDYRTGDSIDKPNGEKIVEVKNIAPTTSFQALIKPKVDIFFSQGFLNNYITRFPALVNNLETIVGTKLRAKNIDYAFYNTGSKLPQPNLATLVKITTGPTGLAYPPSRAAYDYNQKRVYDLGVVIPRESVIEINTTFVNIPHNILVSPDGVNWYELIENSRITQYNYSGQAVKSDVRYIEFTAGTGSIIPWYHEIKVTYETPLVNYGISMGAAMSGNYSNQMNHVTQRVFDLGQSISKDDITRYKIFSRDFARSVHFAVSPDNVNWYYVTSWQPNSYSGHPRGTAYYHTALINKDLIPIPSFRYTKLYVLPTDLTTFGKPNYLDTYLQWISTSSGTISYQTDAFEVWSGFSEPHTDGYTPLARGSNFQAGNYLSNADNSATGKSSLIYDIGTTVNKSAITKFNYYFMYWYNPLRIYASPDNVNWTEILYIPKEFDSAVYIQKSGNFSLNALPANFRYLKFEQVGSAMVKFLDMDLFASGTGTVPRATLADIQSQANAATRPGAKKYVVSLAEEPYTDANITTLTDTANILKNKSVYLAVFADSPHIPSAQQLTSRLTEQKIITTGHDLVPALDQLADTVVSATPFNYSSGPFYILQGQAMAFNPAYSDYEADPKLADNWYIAYDPNFLDNNSGFSAYHNRTFSGPVEVLDKVGKYDLKYRAQDDPTAGDARFSQYRLWSDPAPTSLILHRKPVADFYVTPGTINTVDTSYDPDFQYKRADKGIVEWRWLWKRTTASSWTTGEPTGIPAVGDYQIRLEVKDVYGVWSDPVEKTVTVVDLNKPPVAAFDWTPKPIYEGDNVTLLNQATDPDGESITRADWTIFDPNGVTTTRTYTSKSNQGLNNVLPGTYWVTLRVWDSRGLTHAATKSFSVGTLGITGFVEHTPQWNLNRIRYNRSKTGTDDAPRPYNVFFAGEGFVLKANTTDTGAVATKAASVGVVLLERNVSDYLDGNTAKTFWQGELWQDNFENLSDGFYTFRFYATYANGVVKTHDVSIEIRAAWTEYFQLHRAH